MIVQIYEIQAPGEAEKCIGLGVDHIGSVILYGDEWKKSEIREVVRVSDGTDVKNSLIPLFSDVDTISRVLDYYKPDFIHFCESLTDENGSKKDMEGFIRAQRKIKERFPEIGIIRSIPIPEEGSESVFPALEIAGVLEGVSDLFLTDTWLAREPVEGYLGITGKRCDQKIARDLVNSTQIPVILAGGLSPENVYEALCAVRPAGADSCSLTNKLDSRGEPIRFQKDFAKVQNFIEEIKRAEEIFPNRREQLEREIEELNEMLTDRKAALPAHSILPHQVQTIEELEDKIAFKEKELKGLD
jgi:phosphoribosylanthranilate isomerase